MSTGNSFYGKELIKTSGIWQGGNDWRSPLPWLPQLAHRATCYPIHLPVHPVTKPLHPNTPAPYTHSVTNNAEVGCGKKTETRATDAAMPINGDARELAHQETHWLLATGATDTIVTATIAVSFYTQVSFIEDHLFWMTRQQHFGCTPKQKGSHTTH